MAACGYATIKSVPAEFQSPYALTSSEWHAYSYYDFQNTSLYHFSKKSGPENRNPTTLSTECDGYFFLRYPHFGHTPSSLNATPHSGQRSMSFLVTNSAEAAFTPLVKVILAILSLSFSRS